jgi:CHAT domain-containing protein
MLLGGALAKAERAFQGALQEAENLKDAAGRGDALANLGQVSLLLGKPQRARGYLEDALAVQRAIHSRRGEAVALHLLGSEALSRGDLPAARSAFSQAVAIRRESGMRDEVSESLFELAKLEFQAGNTATARDLVGEAITLIEVERTKVPEASLRASYSSRKHSFYDLLIEIAMSDGHDRSGELGLLASEQAHGRSLADVLSGSRLPGEVPSDLLARRDQVRKQLSVLSLRMTEADPPKLTDPERLTLQARRKELRVQVQPLLAEEGRIDEAIRRTVRGSVLGRPLTYVEHLRKALPRDTAVLEYYLGERHSYLWLIDSTGTRAYRLPPKGDWEKLALRTARSFAAISQRRDSEAERKKFEADRAALAKILVGPLTKVRLPHRLVLVLDGILYQFPVEALRRPGFRDELGLNYEILRAPSAAYLLSGATPRPHTAVPKALLAVADPVFSTEDERFTMRPARSAGVLGLPRLPFGDERKNFQALVPGRRLGELWGFAATPGALLNMDLGIYAVIHFSTHTLIDERTPELSRVVLTQVNRTGKRVDGSLYTHEMADLRLRGATVVLSSCESARGKDVAGEGVVGFGSALLSAGASQLVLSLAKVDSAPAEAFFGEVYRHFLGRRPTTMPAALLRARQHLARSTDWRDPFYWASFTVLGALSNEAPGQPTETSRAHL